MHLELALVGLDELAEGLLVPGPGPDDQIRSHDRILASLLSPGTCVTSFPWHLRPAHKY
jgi:hypothetical protein